MGVLNIEQIMAAADCDEREVDIKQWGGAVRFKIFTKAEIDQIREASSVHGEVVNELFQKTLFLRGVIEPRFNEAQYEQLATKSGAAYYTVLNAIIEENGLSAVSQREIRRTFRSEAGQAVPVPPGAGSGDDGAGVAEPTIGAGVPGVA